MNFAKAADIEQECWSMRLASQKQAQRRQLIDDLFNGFPPYSPEEVAQNKITVNSSNLQATRIHADATNQCKNALLSPSQYFSVKVDRGPSHRRTEYAEIITAELRKAMKSGQSALRYVEKTKNVASSLILHGIGPTVWGDPERWCGSMQAMEDVLIPNRTLLSMENLEHFAIYRRYTPAKLAQMITGPNVMKGWNVDVARRAIEWARKQVSGSDSSDYTANALSPERLAEDIKESGGFWSTDMVATINAYDFYFTDYDQENFGWKRRMVLDCPDLGGASLITGNNQPGVNRATVNILGERGKYLFNSGDAPYASKLSEILALQISDGSVVAPHRYHSTRGLGFLLYSVCEIQNRLYCSINEAAFEALMQYFRASGSADVDRIVQLLLTNRAVVPDGVNFVRPEERWQVNEVLVEKVLNLNKETIADSSTGYNRTFGNEQAGPEKTATQISAEVNASNALVGSMLQDLYRYAKYEHIEHSRRFCIRNSRDLDVRNFRAGCLRRGVPEEVLESECWEVFVEQVMGNGNKQLAIAQSQMEMAVIDRLEPDSQRKVLRDYLVNTGNNPERALDLVPVKPVTVTDSSHDAELSAARMLMGLTMGLRQGVNHSEYAATLLASMAMSIKQIEARGMATPDELAGLQIVAGQTIDGQPIPGLNGPGNGAADHIAILAMNKESKQIVKQLGDALGKLMNEVKAMQQRLQEQQGQAQQQNGNSGVPPEQQAKINTEIARGQAKIKLMADSHQQRSQQKAQIHQQQLSEKAQKAQLDDAIRLKNAQTETAALDIKTAAEIRRQSAQPETATAE